MNRWRLLDSGPGHGPWNLALDEAIFQAVRAGASPPTLRLYRWAAPTLTIGYAQNRDRDVDRDACRARGIEVLRRITGGRAVLHDAELTYGVCVPAGLTGFGTGLDEAYRKIAAGLIAGLRLLGLQAAATAPGRRAPGPSSRPAACFAAAARHEIVVGGRKLVGSAQRREGGAFLQHGSILFESHAGLLAQVLRRQPAEDAASRMVGLTDLLAPHPDPKALSAAIIDGCATAWGVEFLPGVISAEERRAARSLETGRYRSERWNAGFGAVAGDRAGLMGAAADSYVDMRPMRSYHAPDQSVRQSIPSDVMRGMACTLPPPVGE